MRRLFLILLLAAAGCTVGPDYRRPAIAGEGGGWIAPADGGTVLADPWGAIGDPLLADLIAAARAANPDIREAEGRLAEARALHDAAAGRGLPEIDATGSAQRQQLSRNGQLPFANIPGVVRRFPLFDAGFDASWEIDLWGGTRRAIEAAGDQAEAAAARRHETELRIVAEVARSYAELRGAQSELADARAEAEARADIARLARQRFAAGEADRIEDARADAQARTAAAAVPPIDADVRAAAYRLALLTGKPPEALAERLIAPAPVPIAPADVARGLRSDMLRRRPDVRAAEADLAAVTANVGVATADLFPRLSLIGSIGQQARSIGDMGSGASTRFQIGPSLRWPIFDAGRIRAQIRAADARASQAGARYEAAVLGALADSETAINRHEAAQAAVADRAAALAQSAVSLDLAGQRFDRGEDDRIALLEARSAHASADRALQQARRDALEAYAALIKALGGGIGAD